MICLHDTDTNINKHIKTMHSQSNRTLIVISKKITGKYLKAIEKKQINSQVMDHSDTDNYCF